MRGARNMAAHCKYCGIPIEYWEPMESYSSGRCCEFYFDVDNIACDIEELYGCVDLKRLLLACSVLKMKYRDIPDFKAAVKECFELFKVSGVFRLK